MKELSPIEKEIEDAVKEFRGRLTSTQFANTSFVQQYLKGVLENMENGRKAVQEKVKYVTPTIVGFFFAAWTPAALALQYLHGKPEVQRMETLLFLGATILSFFGMLTAQALHRVLVATYNFYVASVIHARIVFGAMDLHHHWTTYVDRAARGVKGRDAKTIKDEWEKKFDFFRTESAGDTQSDFIKAQSLLLFLKHGFFGELSFFYGGHEYENDPEEKNLWSAKVLESWKAQPGTLLDSYGKLLAAALFAHYIFFILFFLTTFYLAINYLLADFPSLGGCLSNS